MVRINLGVTANFGFRFRELIGKMAKKEVSTESDDFSIGGKQLSLCSASLTIREMKFFAFDNRFCVSFNIAKGPSAEVTSILL
jgi:hypothetical protein